MKKITVMILLLSFLTFLFAANLNLLQYEGSLQRQDDSWTIQTETEAVEVYFGSTAELAKLEITLQEQENISVQCALLEDKLTVISYQLGAEKFILRDAESNWLDAVSQSGYKVDAAACIGCNICPSRCPVGAISMVKRKAVIDAEKCIDCGICVDICPVNAISAGE